MFCLPSSCIVVFIALVAMNGFFVICLSNPVQNDETTPRKRISFYDKFREMTRAKHRPAFKKSKSGVQQYVEDMKKWLNDGEELYKGAPFSVILNTLEVVGENLQYIIKNNLVFTDDSNANKTT